jgi:adenosine deaminase
MLSDSTKQLLLEIPKAENHVHLEGAITPELILCFAERNQVVIPFVNEEEARQYFRENTKSLDKFINVFNIINAVLCTELDFYELVMEFARTAKKDNIIYREAMFNYAVHEKKGLSLTTIMKALMDARSDALAEYGVDIVYIAELDRAKDSAWTCEYVRKINDYRESGPVPAVGWALGLEGAEDKNYKAEEFKEAFELAREWGFKTTAHCGEAQGPESVWEVLEYMKVDRIDHGVRAAEDDELIDTLARKGLLLAICPSSNVMINLYPDLAHHPIKMLKDRGVKVSISTDDPAVILDSLTNEYIKTAEALDLSEEELIELVRNGFKYSFSGQQYLSQVDAWLAERK